MLNRVSPALGHLHVPGELANCYNNYAKFLGGKIGVSWDCASRKYNDQVTYMVTYV